MSSARESRRFRFRFPILPCLPRLPRLRDHHVIRADPFVCHPCFPPSSLRSFLSPFFYYSSINHVHVSFARLPQAHTLPLPRKRFAGALTTGSTVACNIKSSTTSSLAFQGTTSVPRATESATFAPSIAYSTTATLSSNATRSPFSASPRTLGRPPQAGSPIPCSGKACAPRVKQRVVITSNYMCVVTV